MAESPRTVMVMTQALLKIADTEAELVTATEYQCVTTSAAITTTPNVQTVPATGCEGPANTPSKSTFDLALSWLQDWSAPGGGLSGYAWDHETELKWFSLEPEDGGPVSAVGQVYVVPGPYLGDMGTPLLASATWNCFAKPTITFPAPAAADF